MAGLVSLCLTLCKVLVLITAVVVFVLAMRIVSIPEGVRDDYGAMR
jgi:hypothetical protein